MVENVQLEEELKEKQEGSKEKGWWEVDAQQLLKAGEELTLEVGNLLERTGDRGEEKVAVIGASMSEPHTSELNRGIFSDVCVYIYRTYVHCTCTRAAYGQYARDLKACADLDTFIILNSSV